MHRGFFLQDHIVLEVFCLEHSLLGGEAHVSLLINEIRSLWEQRNQINKWLKIQLWPFMEELEKKKEQLINFFEQVKKKSQFYGSLLCFFFLIFRTVFNTYCCLAFSENHLFFFIKINLLNSKKNLDCK